MPERILEIPLVILICLVSTFLPEVTQQIHSLRASGVILSHKAATFLSALIACLKSEGRVCIKLFYFLLNYKLVAIRVGNYGLLPAPRFKLNLFNYLRATLLGCF